MLVKLYEKDTNMNDLEKVVNVLNRGGVIIYPTDTVYAIGCAIDNVKGMERMAQLKGIKSDKANFSLICSDLSHISDYSKPFDNAIFKLMKRVLPGPFTFILNANNSVPRLFKSKKKTIGIRVPDNNIPREIVKLLGRPLVTTSVRDDDEIIEYTTDPELIYEKYQTQIDLLVDGGFGYNIASTVVDCTGTDPEVIRQGAGEID